jgi:plasmid stability protein
MAQLLVRNVPERVLKALRRRAADRGRSAEAEHRAILEAALLGEAAPGGFKDYLLAMPAGARDTDFRRSRDRGRRLRW